MTPAQINALPVGPELDRAVHQIVFGQKSRKNPPPYSTVRDAALTILDKVPLFVASVDPDHRDYDAQRPFMAGRLQYEPYVKGDTTIIRLSAPTLEQALCRAALIVISKASGRLPRTN